LSATQSSIDVNTRSSGRLAPLLARHVEEPPHVAGQQRLEEVAAEGAQLAAVRQPASCRGRRAGGVRSCIHDAAPARRLAASPRKRSSTRAPMARQDRGLFRPGSGASTKS
jgi:hypothetical protein